MVELNYENLSLNLKEHMNNRREFLQQSGLLAAGSALAGSGATPSMNFIHHVLFWAKNPNNEAEKNQLFKALKSLGGLPMIQSAHVGKPIITDFDKPVTEGSYTFSVVLTFADAEKEKEYLYHPLHKKFIDDNKHLWGKVQVIDSQAI
ncbi:Dabb family protein [Cytophagaceae bacterium 50C-KIRBA]|uniref:Dabb family protein n=2 Tax=Aquirufa beregesia TaxID=2516556 RepID=A0ABX0EYE6_9BACT|nr:Dabb family protein [Aquirufa beregesia]